MLDTDRARPQPVRVHARRSGRSDAVHARGRVAWRGPGRGGARGANGPGARGARPPDTPVGREPTAGSIRVRAERTDDIVVEVDERGVALVTLDRPERRNALHRRMMRTLLDTVWALDADDAVRVVVLTGAGDAFCSGVDLSETDRSDGFGFSGGDAPDTDTGPEHRADDFAERIAFWRMRTPIVAAINGAAIGAGLTIPLQADVRYVAADAKLAFPFTRLNLVPEANSTWLLPRLVGVSCALELLLSGRSFTGAEAAAMGMASAALPRDEVLPAALLLAHDIAAHCAPVAVGVTKQLVHRSLEEPDRARACTVETRLSAWAGALPDTSAVVAAFRSGSEPSFTGSKHERPPAEIDPMVVLGPPDPGEG